MATDYPAHWEADVLLRDGRTAHLRPIVPEDADELVEFYGRVSDESKYLRFFAPYPRLSQKDLEMFTEVDYDRRVAFVATLATDIIAVGRYDATQNDEAEVAFLVEDAHQGRGLGQLLLEHLAQAGRESGIARFTADVLPENSPMIQIFKDAGYHVAKDYEDGVLRLEFGIDPTDTSVGVMQAREHRSEARSIEAFFTPKGVAVIGASRRHDTVGQSLVRNMVMGGFTGRVFAVNPAAEAVAGLPAYPSVQDIPGDVDLAVVAVPAEHVQDLVLDCAAKGVHGMIVVSSGYAETGEEGRERQRQLLGLSRSYGLRLIGPNCLGIINTDPSVALNASLAPEMPLRGRVGFFCQSGALGVAILESVSRRGLGLSSFVSAGNRADVSGNDLLQYWEEDDDTDVVLLYLESVGNPRKFGRIARRVARRKPIVAVKSGRTTQGVPVGQAVRSSASPQAAIDAVFKQAGVIQVDTLDEGFDVAQILAHQPLPRGPRVSVVGNSYALGLLAADAATAAGLEVGEPVALGPEATADDFEQALDRAVDDPDIDAVVAVFITALNTTGEQVADVLAAVGEQADKPVISTFLASEGVPELLRVPDAEGVAGRGSVPSYRAPETAVRALRRVVEYAAWLNSPEGEFAAFPEIDVNAARRLVASWLGPEQEARELTDAEVGELLDIYGVDLLPHTPVATVEDAIAAGEELGWDVVLKAMATRLQQNPDMPHVWRNIDTPAEMRDAWTTLEQGIGDLTDAHMVVQKMATSGVPVTVGSVEDPLFGPIVSFGLAGAPTELLGDRSYRIPPLTDVDAAVMVREVRAAPLLFGYRGSDPVDVTGLEEVIQRVGRLKHDLPEVAALDLSSILVGAKGCTVLAATGRIAPERGARVGQFVRRLSGSTGDTMPQ